MSSRTTRSTRSAAGIAKTNSSGASKEASETMHGIDTSAKASSTKAKGRSTSQSVYQANMARKRKRLDEEKVKQEEETPKKAKQPKKSATSKSMPQPDLEVGAKLAKSMAPEADIKIEETSPSKAKSKANPYGLSPGQSPFPTYSHPTPEECNEVNRILQETHGKVNVPKTIPAPSLSSSGCGEVPSVLDALVRTRLSAATNNSNSSRAFRGLVEAFGTIKKGVGKGSVDWEKVRNAPQKDVFEAIKTGGLADVKSRDIQKILNMVHEENQAETKGKVEFLSLDHLHSMSNDDAFQKLLGYPGIGPKTASCVLLFCMQRPSFAVDTHVFRLTSALGWVPTDAQAKAMQKRGEASSGSVTRNSTYAHLDVRIPDELKYPLHYLLIRHGKTCPKCSAKKDRSVTEAWGDKPCPLRKAGLMKGKPASAKAVKAEDDIKEEEPSEEESPDEESGSE